MCSKVYENYTVLYKHLYFNHYEGHFQCVHEDCFFWSNLRTNVYEHYRNEHAAKQNNPTDTIPATESTDLEPSNQSSAISNESESTEVATTNSSAPIQPNFKYKVAFLKCLVENCSDFFLDYSELDLHLKFIHSLSQMLCPVLGCRKSFESRLVLVALLSIKPLCIKESNWTVTFAPVTTTPASGVVASVRLASTTVPFTTRGNCTHMLIVATMRATTCALSRAVPSRPSFEWMSSSTTIEIISSSSSCQLLNAACKPLRVITERQVLKFGRSEHCHSKCHRRHNF